MHIRRFAAALALSTACLASVASHGSGAQARADTGDPVIAAVGDMACDAQNPKFGLAGEGTATDCGEQRTSDALVGDPTVSTLLGLGDYQYDCGDPADYAVSYTPTWGRLNGIIDPVAGNHEYQTGTDAWGSQCPVSNKTAAGYFTYFGPGSHPETQGHYSTTIGAWHVIALNGNCAQGGGCSATSAQTKWLKTDLASDTATCTLAFWHQPLFTGIGTGKNTAYQAWWKMLYAKHADMVLNGHIHNYQRFAPMDPFGAPNPAGLTEYVVGSGGETLVPIKASVVPHPVVSAKTFGYLRLTLHSTGWDAQFIQSDGQVLDTSSGVCHNAAPVLSGS